MANAWLTKSYTQLGDEYQGTYGTLTVNHRVTQADINGSGYWCTANGAWSSGLYNTSQYNYSDGSVTITINKMQNYSEYSYLSFYDQNGNYIFAGTFSYVSGDDSVVWEFSSGLSNTYLQRAIECTKLYVYPQYSGGTGPYCNLRSSSHVVQMEIQWTQSAANQAPNTPTLIYPQYRVSNGDNVWVHTYNTQPYFYGKFTDPDGNNMTPYAAMRYVTNNTWKDYNTYSGSTVANNGYATIQPSSALSYNTSYNVRLYAKDTSNAKGGETAKQHFTVYERPLEMSSGRSVTAADFNTLRSAVLTQTDYYVPTIPELPNVTTGTQIQVSQINALKNALNGLPYHSSSQVSATNQYSSLVPANFNNTRAKLW